MSDINRNILSITRCDVQYRSEKMAQFDLKSCHATYLMEICSDPGISQDQLAQRLLINKSNVARQVAVLEELGYVRREVSEQDRRMMEVCPTEKALALLPQIRQILTDWEGWITQDLTPEEIDLVTVLLGKMRARAAMCAGE